MRLHFLTTVLSFWFFLKSWYQVTVSLPVAPDLYVRTYRLACFYLI